MNYGTAAELNTISCVNGAKTVNGTAANVGVGEVASIDLGFSEARVGAGASADFSLTTSATGHCHWSASAGARTPQSPTPSSCAMAWTRPAAASCRPSTSTRKRRWHRRSPTSRWPTRAASSGTSRPVTRAPTSTSTQCSSSTDVYNGGPDADPFAAIPTARLGANDIELLQAGLVDEHLRDSRRLLPQSDEPHSHFRPAAEPRDRHDDRDHPVPPAPIPGRVTGKLRAAGRTRTARRPVTSPLSPPQPGTSAAHPLPGRWPCPTFRPLRVGTTAWGLQAGQAMESLVHGAGRTRIPGSMSRCSDGDKMHVALAFSPSGSLRQALKVKGRPSPLRWGFAAAGTKRK